MSCDCNTLVVGEAGVQGPQGLAGINGSNGTNGINAFTTVGATFTQPAVNDPITFSVVENRWIAVGQTIYISNAGFYTVTVVGGSPFTSVSATLVRAAGVNPAGSVTAGLKVSPSAGATYSDPLSSLTVTGSSILDGATVVNESGAAVDFRVESDTETHLLYTKGSTNRIGVKTSSPAADLDINGTFKVTGLSEFTLGATVNSTQVDSDFVVMTDNFTNTIFVDASADRVGIGISTPQKLLDVNGAGQAVTFLVNPGGVSGVGTFQVNGISSVVPLNVDAATNRVGIKTTTPAVELDVVGATNISGDLSVDTNVLKVDTANNFVGINKTPAVALDVSGATDLNSTLYVVGATTLSSTLVVAGATTLSSTLDVAGAVVMSSSLTVSNNLNVDDVLFVDTSSNKVGVNTTSPTSSFTVSGSANITNDLDARGIFYVKNTGVGINQSSPTVDLDVIGDVAISGTLSATSGNLTTISASSLTVSTSLAIGSDVLFVDTSSNKVGINTTSPTSSLTVSGSADITGALTVSGSADITGGLLAVESIYTGGSFALSILPDVGYTPPKGLVGINKLTPTVPLDVIGDVAISGILTVDTSTLVVDPANNRVGIRNPTPGVELDVTGAVQATSYQIETSAAKITKLYRDSVALVSTNDLTSLTAAGTFQTYSHYVPNVSAGDFAQVTYSSSDNDFEDKVIISAYCTSNYVNIVFFNMSATDFGGTTTANITINILVTRAAAS